MGGDGGGVGGECAFDLGRFVGLGVWHCMVCVVHVWHTYDPRFFATSQDTHILYHTYTEHDMFAFSALSWCWLLKTISHDPCPWFAVRLPAHLVEFGTLDFGLRVRSFIERQFYV